MERFAQLAAQSLSQILDAPVTGSDLVIPPDTAHGDFAFPCFRLAKEQKKAPPALAQELAAKLQAPDLLPAGLTAQAVGPYVNFTASAGPTLAALLGDILAGEGNGSYGSLPAKTRGKWVIEYSSPNVAKPFMIYHFRPTGLGACLDRVGRFRGFDMTSINHLGDWGINFAKLYVASQLWPAELPAEPTIGDLVKLYVKITAAIEADPSLDGRARLAFQALEAKDPEVTGFWKRCIEISMREFNQLYRDLDVKFDHVWGESYYEDQLKPLVAGLKAKGVLKESEGAWIAQVTDEKGRELTPMLLEKSDGTTLYATRDVAALLYRWDQFKFDRMTYVVGGEQKLHFQQIFGLMRQLGHDWVSRCEHVPTGLYRFKDAKMSTRKGNFVTLNDVLELARERVRELISAREAARAEEGKTGQAKLTAQELAETVEKVALGAIVFHDLHADPARDVEFDVERVVDFEGETGPYLQYAHTRCLSIERKAIEQGYPEKITYDPKLVARLTAPEELRLVKTLGQLPYHLERTLSTGKASSLAHFLVDVTKAFGAFYRECHVLGEDRELSQARLMLVEATRRMLGQGLKLIGIPLPERM